MSRFDGTVVLITGGAQSQGRSHAVSFAREGADIVVCDIDEPIGTVPYELGNEGKLEETKRMVEDEGRRCLAATADVRDTRQINDLVGRAVEELGKVDILLANAGIFMPSPLVEMDDEV